MTREAPGPTGPAFEHLRHPGEWATQGFHSAGDIPAPDQLREMACFRLGRAGKMETVKGDQEKNKRASLCRIQKTGRESVLGSKASGGL